MSRYPAVLPPQSARALVIFTDDTTLWWLQPLKKGFRHCALALTHGGDWLMVDPLSSGTAVQSLGVGDDYDLQRWFESHGLTVVPTTVCTDAGLMPLGFYSCVSEVKRILRLRCPWIITPYQLYCYLSRHHRISAG